MNCPVCGKVLINANDTECLWRCDNLDCCMRFVWWQSVEYWNKLAAQLAARQSAEVERLMEDNRDRIRITLHGLKRGECWCEMAVGNPMVKTHSAECIAAQDVIRKIEQ